MDRIVEQLGKAGTAYLGAASTVVFNFIGNISPEDSFVQGFSSFISITVGILTAVYTLTKIIDWGEKKYHQFRKPKAKP